MEKRYNPDGSRQLVPRWVAYSLLAALFIVTAYVILAALGSGR